MYFLESQRGQSTFIDKDIGYVFETFLTEKGVQEGVLHDGLVRSLVARLGALHYGECYIAQPWERLGGSGAIETYGRGSLAVYLSLTGQSVRQEFEGARRARRPTGVPQS